MKGQRVISREQFLGKDKVLAKKLDDLCRKESDKIAEDVKDLKQILTAIETGADKLGCDFHLLVLNGVNGAPHHKELTVADFCNLAKDWMKDDIGITLEFTDGEPGDQFMLVFQGEDPDDTEECAQLLFDIRKASPRALARG